MHNSLISCPAVSKLGAWILSLTFMTGICLAGAVEEGRTSYLSGGRKIKVETYLPAGSARHPAVIVLYGSGGALLGKKEMVTYARQLAEQGMAVFLVHYFNRTRSIVAVDKTITRHWPVWNDTVRDGVDFVAIHPRVRPESIGILGYSLGAYLAISESSADKRIRAVVEIAGGVFDKLQGRTQRFAPTLVLHGQKDERVPVGRVLTVVREARRHDVKPVVKIYENEGHRLSPAARADAGARAIEFLGRHLSR